MSKQELDRLLASFKELEEQVEADPELADRVLIDSGIYTEEGELAEEYV